MKNTKRIAMLGGDQRQWYAARWLREHGLDAVIWGIKPPIGESDDEILYTEDAKRIIAESQVVVLPLPATLDGVYLQHSPAEGEERISLQTVLELLPTHCTVIGGRLPAAFADGARGLGHRVFDYFESEAFQIQNAYITAEASMSIAMNHLAKNLRGSRIAITGYGRIAVQLADLLLRMGAVVTVAARRERDLAFAACRGCHTLQLKHADSVEPLLQGYDVICNTVPSWLFLRRHLEQLDRRTLYVELASAPGGIDVCAAKELALPVFWASSLPGKYAPISAGELIGACVQRIIEEACDV